MTNRLFGRAIALVVIALALCGTRPAAAQFADQGTWAGTAGGTANAIVLSLQNVASLNDIVGVPIRFNPASNNTNAVTVAITNALSTTTATALQRPTSIGLQPLSLNELWAGETTSVTYNGSVFVLTSNVDMTPIGAAVQFRGPTAPRGTLIEDGSCISQTQFATLFAVNGTLYNGEAVVACTGATFAVPDSRGMGFVAMDGQGANGLAGRITTASCSVPNAIGFCGHEQATLTASVTPTISFSGTASVTGSNIPETSSPASQVFLNTTGSAEPTVPTSSGSWNYVNSLSGTSAGTSTGTGGTSPTHPVLNPSSIGRRAIKY